MTNNLIYYIDKDGKYQLNHGIRPWWEDTSMHELLKLTDNLIFDGWFFENNNENGWFMNKCGESIDGKITPDKSKWACMLTPKMIRFKNGLTLLELLILIAILIITISIIAEVVIKTTKPQKVVAEAPIEEPQTCEELKLEDKYYIGVYVFDNCEYIRITSIQDGSHVIHKGNCKYCLRRRFYHCQPNSIIHSRDSIRTHQ